MILFIQEMQKYMYLFYWGMRRIQVMVHVQRSETPCRTPSIMWVPGIELRSSGLVASAFTPPERGHLIGPHPRILFKM